MFIDASAIITVLAEESDGLDIAAKIDNAPARYSSPIVRYEAVSGFARNKWNSSQGENTPMSAEFIVRAQQVVICFLDQIGVEEQPITSEIGTEAIRAMARYGRGTGHPARLNFGDCFSYACAKSARLPLLFKGDDFIHTDIDAA